VLSRETSGGLQSARGPGTWPRTRRKARDDGARPRACCSRATGLVSTRGALARASLQRRSSNNADSSGDDCIAISHCRGRYFFLPNSRRRKGPTKGRKRERSRATAHNAPRVGMFCSRRMLPVRSRLARGLSNVSRLYRSSLTFR